MPHMTVLEQIESVVRSYSRSWPVVFDRAIGSTLYAADGTPYLDFFAGAGTLNYGHNPRPLKAALIDYITEDRITHALDMWSTARAELLSVLQATILAPRGLEYKIMFPGPAGTNAVEAAIKLARKVTGRQTVGYFDNAFHGMTLGAMSVSGKPKIRQSAGIPLRHTVELPFNVPLPDLSEVAAVIVEPVQGEGGIKLAQPEWLRSLAATCARDGALLIVDDIQVGCGRTGPFFSFEPAGITPDVVCLSKSISGYGLPLALTLIRPALDIWAPAEHNGTFRGFNLAFVTAVQALRHYWHDETITQATRIKGQQIADGVQRLATETPDALLEMRGRGLIWGLQMTDGPTATQVSRAAFDRGLLVETCGLGGAVVKLMPPLTVTAEEIAQALDILGAAITAVTSSRVLIPPNGAA